MDARLLALMNDTLVHRGPDAEGLWVRKSIGLAHRRLAIRDRSTLGNQPMSDIQGRIHSVFNGEIYNDGELRRELEKKHGFSFRSACDAEIIPAGYLTWGSGLFERLEGMFSIALWDAKTRQLVLARDGVGIKPLFVCQDAQTVRFASEIKALLVDRTVDRRIRPESLSTFLVQGYVSPSETLLGSVDQIPPGSVRIIGEKETEERSFWQATRQPEISDPRAALDEFMPLWEKVVSDMLVSDVPIGVQQSGGIDSTLVTMTVGKYRDVPAFTACLSEASHDEVALARQVVNGIPAEHKIVDVDEHRDVVGTFRSVVNHLDGQLADSSAFAVYQLDREIGRHVKVVMSGDGADEFYGGYSTYRASRIASTLQPIVPNFLAEYIERAMTFLNRGETRLPVEEVVARFFRGLQAPVGMSHAYWRSLMSLPSLAGICGPELSPIVEERHPHQRYMDAIGKEPSTLVERCMLADQRYYLPSDMLMKVDAMSMAHGLEVRVPFLDRRIMEFAGRLDIELLTPARGPDKKLLRLALERLGAPSAIWRGAKRGFNVPVARLLRTGLSNLCQELLDREADRLAPYLDPVGVRRLWHEHRGRRANHGYALWCLLTFATWKQQLEA